MRHVNLTCKNHPALRWSCKEIAFSPAANDGQGGYNGARSIFFHGVLQLDAAGQPEPFSDGSGFWHTWILDGGLVTECTCPASDLIRAPEDTLIYGVEDRSRGR